MPERPIIYVIDDEVNNLDLLRRTLTPLGEIFAYDDAERAFVAAERQRPTLLLVDLRLGGMSGIDFLRRLRERGIDSPALLVTGFLDDSELQKAKDEKLVLWTVSKPWEPEAMRAQVQMALSSARMAKLGQK